jgi:hypothetical protein
MEMGISKFRHLKSGLVSRGRQACLLTAERFVGNLDCDIHRLAYFKVQHPEPRFVEEPSAKAAGLVQQARAFPGLTESLGMEGTKKTAPTGGGSA